MLELKQIKKDYPAGDGVVHALKGINLRFRQSEFVSILGPSGCGKTTMLNIIGGLDQYTQGDLVIGGRSTKDFRDRDWDAYRNHSVGFVFQSYNLIPHQTVLQNVELALSLSGVSKSQRRKRAIQALEAVGLGSQLKKRPGEMSGGQMQRVAIARALVNDPDIILADEPTGALDTETSVQIMDILKEVARERLVIMVTHNPELAQRYSTRIIRMLDGEITHDSAPLTEDELTACKMADKAAIQEKKREKKPSMRMTTAFGLSLKNLMTKRGRTVLTSFAGSIGIIGIALIFAVSQGMTTYINTVQEDTLSSYPLTIQATTIDMGSLMSAFLETAQSGYDHDTDGIYSKPIVYDLINAMNDLETTENDLAAFREFIEQRKTDPEDNSGLYGALSGVQYSYDLNLQVYTKNVDGTVILSDSQSLMQDMMMDYMGVDVSSMLEMREKTGMMDLMSSSGAMSMNLWQEMLPGEDGKLVSPLLEKQYDLIYGNWPNSCDQVVLVVDENNELDDMTLYALGLKPEEEISAIMDAVTNRTQLPVDTRRWSYEEICGMEYRVALPGDCYQQDPVTGLYTDLRQTDAGLRYLYDNGTVLTVSGIIRPADDAVSAMLTGSIGYTTALTEYVIRQSADSQAAVAQMLDPTTDIFTGLPFRDTTGNVSDEMKEADFRAYVDAMDEAAKAEAYKSIMSIPSEAEVEAAVDQTISSMTRADMEAAMIQNLTQQLSMSETELQSYIGAMKDEEITELFSQAVAQQFTAQYAAQVQAQLAPMEAQQLAAGLDQAMASYSTQQCARYYDEILEFSDSDYESNLVELGCLELSAPAAISLYAASFESKEIIETAIEDYNAATDEAHQISYTDYVGLMMHSVTTIIDAITYVLVAFVAISLVVSSIMIGVITLISVQERTKEIGILRAIGASKKNVSSMFSAETIIIGFTAGLLGIAVTDLLCLPINAIIQYLTGIAGLKAVLPWQVALILIGISVLLTMIAGIIPSRSAARKDPVVALRSE